MTEFPEEVLAFLCAWRVFVIFLLLLLLHGKADRHMKLLTLERESSLGSLWDQEQCTQFCSKDELWETAKEEEMRIPWKDGNEESSVSEEQYQDSRDILAAKTGRNWIGHSK